MRVRHEGRSDVFVRAEDDGGCLGDIWAEEEFTRSWRSRDTAVHACEYSQMANYGNRRAKHFWPRRNYQTKELFVGGSERSVECPRAAELTEC